MRDSLDYFLGDAETNRPHTRVDVDLSDARLCLLREFGARAGSFGPFAPRRARSLGWDAPGYGDGKKLPGALAVRAARSEFSRSPFGLSHCHRCERNREEE